MDLPYRAEYAKSGRSSCKACKTPIGQGDLRLAVMVQSAHFDGRQPNWYHFKCFFNKQRVKTVDDIEHFESLRIDDQDKIRKNVGVGADIIVPDAKKGKKRAADKEGTAAKQMALKDYKIEYSKSGRAMCRGCEQKILKDEVRISKKDFDTDVGKKYGGQDMWHHINCFAQLRSTLGYFECGDKLPGFKDLSKEDQAKVKKEIPAIKQEDVPPEVKKPKIEDDPVEKEYRAQNKIMYQYRDQLRDVPKPKLIYLLEYNGQAIPEGIDRILDRLADNMTFGTLLPCKKCKDGQLVFNKFGYICTGDLSEWAKCQELTKEPERKKFKIPSNLASDYSFLKKFKYVPRKRILKEVNPSVPVKKEVKDEVDGKPKVVRALPALYDMEFVILGHPSKSKDVLKHEIQALGGKVVTKISKSVMAVISTRDEVEKMGARMRDAEAEQIQVVPDNFVDEAQQNTGKIPDLIKKMSICSWGSDPNTRLPPEPSSNLKSHKSKSRFTSKVPSKMTLKLKGGTAVDPDSHLEDVAHVYEEHGDKYTAVLGLTDVQNNKNSYYKLQILEADNGNRYWLFRSWGRIGTIIGGDKTEPMSTVYDAKKQFHALYLEKSGNDWEDRHEFVKIPGRLYPIDIDYSDGDTANLDIVDGGDSSLPVPVQNLMKLIFDVKQMKKLMLEFELDMEKMPLGKLSQKQIQQAFGVLSELQNLIEKGGSNETKLIEATNRFYTLIPHNFGVDEIQILRDKETIKQKLEMLDSLMEMEVAYNLMKSSGGQSVDSYYQQLKAEIGIVHKEHEEFEIIKEYLKNTHAATHGSYDLEVQDVFTVLREGEDKRYKPFRKLHNRKLLWHGSRTTNFAGILSQGLRIAPPEAPVTGYMFGKGIYFADMVSKSANYCCTGPSNPTGLLLICEVALGNEYERPHADYINKLPKGKHSVKGVGRTHPDPSYTKEIDSAVVPLGKGVPNPGTENNSLLYNEFIVYDVAQVRIKYLVKVNFKYKY